MLKPKEILIKLRASFWFIPLITVLVAIILAMVLIEVDSVVDYKWAEHWPRLFGVGADGARGMLSTIAGSIMTMMGVTFSMTLVTLALASSQYSSRVLRNFIRNRLTQSALGIFAAIFTYSLVVLRTIRGGDTDFVPNLSIFVGFVLALVGVGVLVLFIHHVATSIQAANIISSVAEETIGGIKKLFPDELGTEVEDVFISEKPGEYAKSILSDRSGYIQTIDEKPIDEFSEVARGKIWVNFRIGEFVVQGVPLIHFESKNNVDEKTLNHLKSAFSIQAYRTIEQDVLFGIRQLVDIALKALSPGVNDTTTAILCIDYLTSILSHLVNRKLPTAFRQISNDTLVIVKRPKLKDFFSEAFSQIRSTGKGNYAVQERLLWSLETLSGLTKNPQRREIFSMEAKEVREIIKETFELQSEKNKLEIKYAQTNERLLRS